MGPSWGRGLYRPFWLLPRKRQLCTMEGYEMHALRGSREQRRVLREEEIEARALQHFRADSERTSLDNQAWARSASRRQAQELAMQAYLHEEVAAPQQQLACEEALLHTCSERRSEEAAFDNLRSYSMYSKNTRSCNPGLRTLRCSTYDLQMQNAKTADCFAGGRRATSSAGKSCAVLCTQ